MSESQSKRIGGFRILEALKGGSGSQGTVYRAVCEEEQLPGVHVGDVVALKTMAVADEDGSLFRKLKQRTDRLALIRHPNVVRYFGCFSVTDAFSSVHVVVMECLEGRTLKDLLHLNGDGLDVDEAMRIVRSAVDGLAAATAVGLVHRDVKPSNVFLCSNGAVKVIDFEIARSEGGTLSTGSGRFLGTFDYMAPEFTDVTFRGDVRSDIFSMGVVLHEALAGKTPYAVQKSAGRGQADFDFIDRWSNGGKELQPIRISSRATRLLAGVDDVLAKTLTAEREKRFADFREFAAALAAVKFRELRNGENRYRLLRLVGKGGFGEVFKARTGARGRLVAVKHLMKAAYGDRFRREARIMQKFREPCFTQFIDYFETGNAGTREAFLVMEFLPNMPGSSLRDAIRGATGGRLDPQEVLKAFVRYAHGLAVMHGEGVYHRDIKPSNLYYPDRRPDEAVIMDMGIARDTGGSVTSGQVPGTLDYMPPEIVNEGSRGDARMDVYALGLCLYEALTGKMGYSRLPTGPDALTAFYRRAKSMLPPQFDDAELARRPTVLEVLRRMTDPDCRRRLQDAAAAERLLRGLDWGGAEAASGIARPPASSASASRRSFDPPTGDTSPTGASVARKRRTHPSETVHPRSQPMQEPPPHPAPPRRQRPANLFWARFASRALTAAIVLVVVGLVGAVAWPYVRGGLARLQDARAQEELARQKREELVRRQEANARSARQAAQTIVEKFRAAVSPESVDPDVAAWLNAWKREPLPDGFLDGMDEELKLARSNCIGRLRDRASAAGWEADAVGGAYDNAKGEGELSQTDERAEAWAAKWRTNGLPETVFARHTNAFAVAQAKCRQRLAKREEDLAARQKVRQGVALRLKSAGAEADALVTDFGGTEKSRSVVAVAYAGWRRKWAELEREPEFRRLDVRIRQAQQQRLKSELERTVVAECRRLLENVWLVTSENVRNWRVNLDRALIELKKADADGRVSEAGRAAMEREIADMRRWAVGVVDNKSHETLTLMGREISPVSEATFVFTNGIPGHAAIMGKGCEPIRLRRETFDGRTMTVMKEDLRPTVGTSEIVVPPLPEGVVCLVDGRLVSPGAVKVHPGRHSCVYRNERETYPGTRDFLDQELVVETVRDGSAKLSAPGDWREQSEFHQAKDRSERVGKGDALFAKCMKLMERQPIETRRERLRTAHAVIEDWQTPSAVGDARLKELRRKFAAESKVVVGVVVNDLAQPLKVKVYDRWVTVAAGGGEEIAYAEGLPKDAHVAATGYERLALPAADFDGKSFVVTQELLEPIPVLVTVPDLESGVVCRLSGKVLQGADEFKPGRYVCVYSRPGFSDQRFQVEVKVGSPLTLPPPGTWEKSGVFGALMDAVRDVTDATSRGMQNTVDTMTTIERKKKE